MQYAHTKQEELLRSLSLSPKQTLFAPFATATNFVSARRELLAASCAAFLITALDSRIAPYQKRGEPVDLLAHTRRLAFPPGAGQTANSLGIIPF